MIRIDGSHGEGGGQIVRTAVALSAVAGKGCEIANIRGGREQPGLRAQHVSAIGGLAKLCGAEVEGNALGSQSVVFKPSEIDGGKISLRIATAGSVGLVLQGIMLACVHAKKPVEVHIKGGATFGKWAPPVHYLQKVLAPLLEKAGYIARIDIVKHGYYPVGGAEVKAIFEPCELAPLNVMERGGVLSLHGISNASDVLRKSRVAERQAKAAKAKLFGRMKLGADVAVGYSEAPCPGSGVQLWATTENSVLGGCAIGERGKRAEDVGADAASELARELKGGAVDRWAGDQLVPYLVPGSEIAVSAVTKHCMTNIWVVEQFLDRKYEIEGNVIKVI